MRCSAGYSRCVDPASFFFCACRLVRITCPFCVVFDAERGTATDSAPAAYCDFKLVNWPPFPAMEAAVSLERSDSLVNGRTCKCSKS